MAHSIAKKRAYRATLHLVLLPRFLKQRTFPLPPTTTLPLHFPHPHPQPFLVTKMQLVLAICACALLASECRSTSVVSRRSRGGMYRKQNQHAAHQAPRVPAPASLNVLDFGKYAVLCCAVLCCTALYCTVLHCTVLYPTPL